MISVLLPTTGRPEMAERCVARLLDTTDGVPLEICVAIDNCPETLDRIAGIDHPPRAAVKIDYRQELRGNSQAWNDCLAASTGDPVVFAADDLEWGDGWWQNAAERLSQFPDGWGLVGFNDGHWGEELSTHYLMSRRFVVEVLGGVVAWPEYVHSFNDAEVNLRARQAGRYAWAEDAHVYHSHWLFGDRHRDETDTRTLGGHGAAERTFLERKAAGFPNDGVEPVITC